VTGLADAAAAALPTRVAPTPLEQLWLHAALHSTATGRRTDPPVADLRRLTEPASAWQGLPPWPVAAIQDRIDRLMDCHRLAISYQDADWLDQLDAVWAVAPVDIDELWPLRAQGEIRLARVGAPGWQPDEVELMVEEAFLVPANPADRAWLALAGRDPAAASGHLAAYEALLADLTRTWVATPEEGIRQICAHPETVLQVQARALHVLVANAGPGTDPVALASA
jgi:hypothetical protein